MIKRVTYIDRDVLMLVQDQEEHIQKNWMLKRFYETQRNGMLNYIFKNYKPGGVYVDCGASIGNHTIFFSKIMRADIVYAFEPLKSSYDHLEINAKLNQAKIKAWNVALGKTIADVSMIMAPGSNIGMAQVDEQGTGVKMITLDSVIINEKLYKIKIIKIDVEHYNTPLLRGAEETLKYFFPDVFIECESAQMMMQTKRLMHEYGYEMKDIVFNHTPTYLFRKIKKK